MSILNKNDVDDCIKQLLNKEYNFHYTKISKKFFSFNYDRPTFLQYTNLLDYLFQSNILPSQQQFNDIYSIIKKFSVGNNIFEPHHLDYCEFGIKIIYKYPDYIKTIYGNSLDTFFINIIDYYFKVKNNFDELCGLEKGEFIPSFIKINMDSISVDASIKILKSIRKDMYYFKYVLLFEEKLGVDGYIKNSLTEQILENVHYIIKNEYRFKKQFNSNKEESFLFEIIKSVYNNTANENYQKLLVSLMVLCDNNNQIKYYDLIDENTNLNINEETSSYVQSDKTIITKAKICKFIKPLVEIGGFNLAKIMYRNEFCFDYSCFKLLGLKKCIELFREYQKEYYDQNSERWFQFSYFWDEIFTFDESFFTDIEKNQLGIFYIKEISYSQQPCELNEIFKSLDRYQGIRNDIIEHFLHHFIVKFNLNEINNLVYSYFKKECNEIISNKSTLKNRLSLALICGGNDSNIDISRVNNQITLSDNHKLPFIIVKDILILFLHSISKPSEFIELSTISKKTFSMVTDYINNSITGSSLFKIESLIGKYKLHQMIPKFSLVQLNNLKCLKIFGIENFLKQINIFKSLEYIEIQSMGKDGWKQLKSDTNYNILQLLKERNIKIEIESINIAKDCDQDSGYDLGIDESYSIRKDKEWSTKCTKNSNNIDFNIISKLEINISSFLILFKQSQSILNINHLILHATLYFDYNLVLDFQEQIQNNNQLENNSNKNINEFTNSKLETLEINLHQERSIERILNIFKYFSNNLKTIKFKLLFYNSSSLISTFHSEEIYSTIFYLISTILQFKKVNSIIIVDGKDKPLYVKNWDTINYYSFKCNYPYDFNKFTRDITINSVLEIPPNGLYGNNIKECIEKRYDDEYDSGYDEYDDYDNRCAADCDGYDDLLHGD